MNNTTVALHQVEFEQKSFWRNPAAAFFAFLFPIIFLVVFASLFKGQTVQIGTVRTSYDNYYIPALVAFGVMGACFTNIAVTISLRSSCTACMFPSISALPRRRSPSARCRSARSAWR